MPPGAPGMGNVFVNQGGVLKRVCIKENFNPACCDSRLTCGQRPVENCCTAHNTAVSGCAWSHPGESSGSCIPWNPAHCGAETKNHCVLQATNHNVLAGSPRCKSGWTGSCSYRCNDGNFDKITNSCKKNCSSKEFPIAGTRCVLQASDHDIQTTGTCTSSYGECSGRCNNGHWEGVANTCYTPRGCGGKTISNCRIGEGTHDSQVNGRCINNTTGNCKYHCVDSVWKKNHYSCGNRCSGKPSYAWNVGSIQNKTYYHGNTATAQCIYGYNGRISYRCNNGNWSKTSGQCTTGRSCRGVLHGHTEMRGGGKGPGGIVQCDNGRFRACGGQNSDHCPLETPRTQNEGCSYTRHAGPGGSDISNHSHGETICQRGNSKTICRHGVWDKIGSCT